MLEGIIFGIVQGITEWLPVSSEGFIVLLKVNFFGGAGIEDIVKFALFLHLGTALAAIVYFRKDVVEVFKTLSNYQKAKNEHKKVFDFLFTSTFISGIIGFTLLKMLSGVENAFSRSTDIVNFTIGAFLIITAFLQLQKRRTTTNRTSRNLDTQDGIVLGIVQGFSVLPGFSRSGLTIASLILRKFNEEHALKLSFLMSIPIVLVGNVFLNLNYLRFSPENIFGVIFSFIFGLTTIHVLLRVAKKFNFAYFILIFGILMMTSLLF